MSQSPTFPEVESTLFGGLARLRDAAEARRGAAGAHQHGAAGAHQHGAAGAPQDASAECGEAQKARALRYEMHGEIGRGGMGAVYEVLDTDLQRLLAMKVALRKDGKQAPSEEGESMLTRFLEEAQVTGQLDHPGIVPLHEVGMDSKGQVYFTMRLVKGRHLGEIFELAWKDEQGWNRYRVVSALIKVCEALAYAHSKGVVHRDIKPSNVMAGRFGEVYVMDWGLAKVRGRPGPKALASGITRSFVHTKGKGGESANAFETLHGTVFGTPAYMAPEQARGDVDAIDARSDVYSLGAMLYHLIAKRPPYARPGAQVAPHVMLQWVLDGPPPALAQLAPDAPPELVAVCEKAMAREADERYSDMLSLADDLQRYLSGRPVVAQKLSGAGRVWRWCRRNRVAALTLVGIIVAAGFGIASLAGLSGDLVRHTAVDSARMQADMLQQVNVLYASSVSGRVDRAHVTVTHDYAQKAGAIPIPATFLTELAGKITEHGGGMQVKHYSDFPFKFRAAPALDGFETRALAQLRLAPDEPVVAFEDVAGRPSLRYAVARRMEASCVPCHNSHPDSPKTDWMEGDVRGVLEIVRPLDEDVARTRKGVLGRLLIVGTVVGALLSMSIFMLVRRGAPEKPAEQCEIPTARKRA